MANLSKDDFDEILMSAPPTMTSQQVVEGLVARGHRIDGYNPPNGYPEPSIQSVASKAANYLTEDVPKSYENVTDALKDPLGASASGQQAIFKGINKGAQSLSNSLATDAGNPNNSSLRSGVDTALATGIGTVGELGEKVLAPGSRLGVLGQLAAPIIKGAGKLVGALGGNTAAKVATQAGYEYAGLPSSRAKLATESFEQVQASTPATRAAAHAAVNRVEKTIGIENLHESVPKTESYTNEVNKLSGPEGYKVLYNPGSSDQDLYNVANSVTAKLDNPAGFADPKAARIMPGEENRRMFDLKRQALDKISSNAQNNINLAKEASESVPKIDARIKEIEQTIQDASFSKLNKEKELGIDASTYNSVRGNSYQEGRDTIIQAGYPKEYLEYHDISSKFHDLKNSLTGEYGRLALAKEDALAHAANLPKYEEQLKAAQSLPGLRKDQAIGKTAESVGNIFPRKLGGGTNALTTMMAGGALASEVGGVIAGHPITGSIPLAVMAMLKSPAAMNSTIANIKASGKLAPYAPITSEAVINAMKNALGPKNEK